jgi:hypothetical protein
MCKKLISLVVVLLLAGSASAALVVQYDFEGNANDSTANNFHGTVTDGTLTYGAQGLDGGQAGVFDGTDAVGMPLGTISWADKNITRTWWARSTTTSSDRLRFFNARDNDPATETNQMYVTMTFDGILYWVTGVGPSAHNVNQINGAAALVTNGGNWTHWAMTLSPTTTRILKNGIIQNETNPATVYGIQGSVTDELGIGKYHGHDNTSVWWFWVGHLDDFRIYDTTLSVTDIRDVMAEMPEPTTIALLGLGALALIRKRRAQ